MLWTVAAAGRLRAAPARRRGRRASRAEAAGGRRLGARPVLPFWLSIGVLSLVQARAGRGAAARRRARSSPACAAAGGRWCCRCSIAVVIGGDRPRLRLGPLPHLPGPVRGAAAGGAGAGRDRPRRPPAACPAGHPALRPRLGRPGHAGGETAALALSALACVSLGWLLACVVPGRWLKLGIYAMAAIDAWLVGSDLLQEPNAVLNAAAPGRPAAPAARLLRLGGDGLRRPLHRRHPRRPAGRATAACS